MFKFTLYISTFILSFGLFLAYLTAFQHLAPAQQSAPAATTMAGAANAGPFEDGQAAYQRQDYATALQDWRPLADHGDAGAQSLLGGMYAQGQGVAQDYAEAVKWLRLAANQGNAGAQYNLGVCYHFGRGVPQDYAEAAKWFRKAAEQGFADAQFNVGVLYEHGRGVPQDYAEAVRWYGAAAKQGNARGQYGLGLMYSQGLGVPKDDARAMHWYRLAADQGDAEAQAAIDASTPRALPANQDQAKAAFDRTTRQAMLNATPIGGNPIVYQGSSGALAPAQQSAPAANVNDLSGKYRECVFETIKALQAADEADRAKFIEENRGMPRRVLLELERMPPPPSAADIEMARQANFMRIKELCRLKFPCADGESVSDDYNACLKR